MTASALKRTRKRKARFMDSRFDTAQSTGGFTSMVRKEKLIGVCQSCYKLGVLDTCECMIPEVDEEVVGYDLFVKLSKWVGYWKSVVIAVVLWGGGVVACFSYLMQDWFR